MAQLFATGIYTTIWTLPPHIHAIYGEYEGILDLRSMNMIEGDLPARALKLVQEWMALHQSELLAMWNNKQIKKLPPLV